MECPRIYYTKQSNPEYAEQIRANFFDLEKRVEQTMRETAERQKTAPPKNPRVEAERRKVDKCIRYPEDELARLSPADRAAPAYVSLKTLDLKQPPRSRADRDRKVGPLRE